MFEIHATVISNDVEQFKKDCLDIGCKPLLIELQNKNGASYNQMMTSKKYSHKNWKLEIKKTKNALEKRNYKINRIKVEINPYAYKNIPIKYYETHFRIKLNNEKQKDFHVLIEKFKFHKSKNIFKKIDEEFYYQMATYRTYDLNIKDFEEKINQFKLELKLNNLTYDKVEIEACILDTNNYLDNKWLN